LPLSHACHHESGFIPLKQNQGEEVQALHLFFMKNICSHFLPFYDDKAISEFNFPSSFTFFKQ